PLWHTVTPAMGEIVDLQVLRAHRSAPPPRLDPIVAGRIENRDQPDHAGIAFMPFPGEPLERAALARHLVEIGADVLDRRDAGSAPHLVRRVPLGKIIDRLAAGRLLVLREEILDLRT